MRTYAGVPPCLRRGGTPNAYRPLGRPLAAVSRYESDSRTDQQEPGQQHMTAPRLALAYALDLLLGDPEWFPHPVRGFGLLIRAGERWLRCVSKGPRQELVAGAALTCSITSLGWILGRPSNPTWQVLMAWTALATRSLLSE